MSPLARRARTAADRLERAFDAGWFTGLCPSRAGAWRSAGRPPNAGRARIDAWRSVRVSVSLDSSSGVSASGRRVGAVNHAMIARFSVKLRNV
jgi:hypothetical protein